MSRRVILVLEDAAERVGWLRSIFWNTPYEVVVFDEVALFVETALARSQELALVIFDHDLGSRLPDAEGPAGSLPNYDVNGKTGEDAAKQISPFACQALVWSWNAEGGRRIAYVLHAEKKATRIRRAPFQQTPEYAALIASMVAE